MKDENKEIKKLASQAFNACWDLIDKKDRTPKDDANMLAATFSQLYLWNKIGTDLNRARGEWQVSRVYALLKKTEECLFHAEQCLDYTEKAKLDGFDLVFAYESLARAYSLMDQKENYQKFYDLGVKALDQVEKKEDRDYCRSELDSILKL